MNQYKVVEKFVSINGEAKCAGELACFIRFAGCNLACSYCDTMWANKKDVSYELMTADDIYNYIKESRVKNVTLTGGEPLIQDNIRELIERLAEDESLRIELETNGSVNVSSFRGIGKNVTFTIDYKLPGSGMSDRMCLDNFKEVTMNDSVKFVVSNENDLIRAKEIIKEYDLERKTVVYISSAFNEIKPKDIVTFMIDNNMNNIRLQLQMHKYIWGADMKGV